MKTKSIETKYNLGDTVFVKNHDCIEQSTIVSITIEQLFELNEEITSKATIHYRTKDASYFEEDDEDFKVAKSKEQLDILIKKQQKQLFENIRNQIKTNISNHKNGLEYENKRLKEIEKKLKRTK